VPTVPTLRTVCAVSVQSKETAELLAKLDHKPQTRVRASFEPHVGDVKHNDVPLAGQKRTELVKNGTIQKVKVKVDKRARKKHPEVQICTVCSFYLAHDRPPVEDVGPVATGCYYLYKSTNCPHAIAASSDPAKFNGTSTMSMKELGKYVVETKAGEVDLARWIYAKFHGTAYTTDGRCLSDKSAGSAGSVEAVEAVEADGKSAKSDKSAGSAGSVEAVEAAVMGNARLAGRDAPRHVPLSSLRLVTGTRK
jgi:hypothetical protein